MTPVPAPAYLEAFSTALVSELKAEMGRQSLSARGLALRIGENPQYVTSRLGAGNPRTGKLVAISVADLAAMAGALDVDPRDLYDRAAAAAAEVTRVIEELLRGFDLPDPSDTPDLAMAAHEDGSIEAEQEGHHTT